MAVALLIAAIPSAVSASTLVRSAFRTDNEGWQTDVVGEASRPAAWAAPGNHPSGEIYARRDAPTLDFELVFSAPAKFLGNKRAAYRGSLGFDQNIGIRTVKAGNICEAAASRSFTPVTYCSWMPR